MRKNIQNKKNKKIEKKLKPIISLMNYFLDEMSECLQIFNLVLLWEIQEVSGNFFKLSKDLMLVTWSNDRLSLKIGASHCKSESCLVLVSVGLYWVCHMYSHDQLIDSLCKFMGESSLQYVTMLVSLLTITSMIMEI